jgi:lipoate---protein ligase
MFFYLDETGKNNPYYNLAREEALALSLVEFGLKGGIRFWTNSKTIVLGLSDSVSKNVPEQIIQNWEKVFVKLTTTKIVNFSNIWIARRSSGGGTVYQDHPGNLNYSLFINLKEKRELFPVKDSYQILLGLVDQTIQRQGITSTLTGKSDLSLEKDGGFFKISGNSQFRKKDCIVQHGTLILDPNLIETISGHLFHPPEEPEYRKKRSHREFLTSLPAHFSAESFKKDLKSQFMDYLNLENAKVPREFWRKVASEIPKIQKSKFQNKDFIFGKP